MQIFEEVTHWKASHEPSGVKVQTTRPQMKKLALRNILTFMLCAGLSHLCGKTAFVDVWQLFPVIVFIVCSRWDIKSTIILDVTQQPVSLRSFELVPRLTQPPYIPLICNTLPTTPLLLCLARRAASRLWECTSCLHVMSCKSHVKIIRLLYQISVTSTRSCVSVPPAGMPTKCKCVCLLLCQCVCFSLSPCKAALVKRVSQRTWMEFVSSLPVRSQTYSNEALRASIRVNWARFWRN